MHASRKIIGFLWAFREELRSRIDYRLKPLFSLSLLRKPTVVSGTGQMRVDDETRQAVPGDATWIPVGSVHALLNNGEEDCVIIVVASPL